MLNRSTLSFRNDILPLRLIDLSATLESRSGVHFADATDWYFHVVSHTWSKDIRDLSDRIGLEIRSILEEGGGSGQRRTMYNDCFANPQFDLADDPHYKKFMDFLRILASEGVKKFWFDALCINQKDDDEKAREICHMGAYYRLSAGCYVVTHGIGTELGFKALDLHPAPSKVPRWFTRVWTYQEAILPKNLMFIVESFGSDGLFMDMITSSIYSTMFDTWLGDWDKELVPHQWSSETYFRRRIAGDGGCKEELYVLGMEAYSEMIKNVLDFWSLILPAAGTSKVSKYLAFEYLGDNIGIEVVARAIQQRECTVEEDRVLGILGLLGFKGEHQLRTKQTLEQQLLWLAKTLMVENPDLLVNLCAADFEGYHEMPCASWLPDLRYKQPHFDPWQQTKNDVVVTRCAATITEVKEDGKLVMRARTIQACLQGCSDERKVRLQVGASFNKDFSHIGDDFFSARISEQPNLMWLGAGFQIGGLSIPAPSIHKVRSHQHPGNCTICQLMLLLLGHNERGECIVMLCVSDTDHFPELHKVGIANFERKPLMDLFSLASQELIIGSFGNDLTRCLSKEFQELLQNLTPLEKSQG